MTIFQKQVTFWIVVHLIIAGFIFITPKIIAVGLWAYTAAVIFFAILFGIRAFYQIVVMENPVKGYWDRFIDWLERPA